MIENEKIEYIQILSMIFVNLKKLEIDLIYQSFIIYLISKIINYELNLKKNLKTN